MTRPVRETFAEGVEQLIGHLARLIGEMPAEPGEPGVRDRAIGLFATLTGAIMLARATAGRSISDEILAGTRRYLAAVR